MLLAYVCKEICVETLTEIEIVHMAQRWLSGSWIVQSDCLVHHGNCYEGSTVRITILSGYKNTHAHTQD